MSANDRRERVQNPSTATPGMPLGMSHRPQPRRCGRQRTTSLPRHAGSVLLLGTLCVLSLTLDGAQAQDAGTAQSTSPSSRTPAGRENGIAVGRAKVFDNRTLTLMLETMADTLKNLQVIEQDPLRKAIGLLQGSQTTDVARSLSVLSGGSPKTVTTEDSTTQTDTQSKPSTTDASVEALIDKKISEKLGLKTETTSSERNPALPTLPDLIASPSGLPGFGQNPIDLLTDQVNLTYQILNIRMLLERSLSDRLLKTGEARLQTVLGFNVSIDPPRGSENSAAVVEVTVTTSDPEPVSLVSLMPQEKTYNAVAVNTSSNAFGGSAVAGMMTVGYSERRRGQIFYLYRDNDTLSFERMVTADKELTFGWQFRPVLGRKSVSAGMRQMFAVVSVPVSDAAKVKQHQTLNVAVKTYWRKYYPRTLTTADREKIGPWPYVTKVFSLGLAQVVPNANTATRPSDAPAANVLVPTTAKYQDELAPKIWDVRWTRIDDMTALISVEGDNFFSGTSVAMGGTSAPAGVVIKSSQAMEVVTPLENVGAGTPMVIGRYGIAQPLVAEANTCIPTSYVGTKLTLPFGGQRELSVPVNCPVESLIGPDAQLVIFANGKPVPGVPQVSKSETTAGGSVITTSIPIDLFPRSDGTIAIVRPFRAPFRIEFPWYDNAYDVKRMPASGKTVLFVVRKDGVELDNKTAFGAGAQERWKIEHGGSEIKPTFPSATVMRFELGSAEADGTFMLFEPGPENGTTLYLLEMPAAKPKPKAAIEPVSAAALPVNQNDSPKLEFTGESIENVTLVRIEGRDAFKTEYDGPKRVLSVYVPQEVTKLPAKLTMQFRDKAGKLLGTSTLEIKAVPKDKQGAEVTTRQQQ